MDEVAVPDPARTPSSRPRRIAWDLGAILALLCWAKDNHVLNGLLAAITDRLTFIH